MGKFAEPLKGTTPLQTVAFRRCWRPAPFACHGSRDSEEVDEDTIKVLSFLIQVAYFALSQASGIQIVGEAVNFLDQIRKRVDSSKLLPILTLVIEFEEAKDAESKAKALLDIAKAFAEIGGIQATLESLMSTLSSWDWLMAGVVVGSEVLTWFEHASSEIVDEVASKILSTEDLLIDSHELYPLAQKLKAEGKLSPPTGALARLAKHFSAVRALKFA